MMDASPAGVFPALRVTDGFMTGLNRTVALVGMMGAGKTSLGRRLAARLNVPFRDADIEIERAANCTIPEIFDRFGETGFRDGERKVVARLLGEAPHILATGGGAFADTATRTYIKDGAFSIWIKAPLDLLMSRVSRRDDRPLLKNDDPRGTMERLLAIREPFYAEADMTIESEDGPHSATVERVVAALAEHGVYKGP